MAQRADSRRMRGSGLTPEKPKRQKLYESILSAEQQLTALMKEQRSHYSDAERMLVEPGYASDPRYHQFMANASALERQIQQHQQYVNELNALGASGAMVDNVPRFDALNLFQIPAKPLFVRGSPVQQARAEIRRQRRKLSYQEKLINSLDPFEPEWMPKFLRGPRFKGIPSWAPRWMATGLRRHTMRYGKIRRLRGRGDYYSNSRGYRDVSIC